MARRRSILCPGGSFRSHLFTRFWVVSILLLVGSCSNRILGVKYPFMYMRWESGQFETFQASVVYSSQTPAQCIAKCAFMPYCFAVEYHVSSGECRISETAITIPTKCNADIITMIPEVLPKVTHILILGGQSDQGRAIWEYIPETKLLSKKEITLPTGFNGFHYATYTRDEALYIIIESSYPTPIMLIKANPLSIENADISISFSPNILRCGVVSADGRYYYSLGEGKLHKYDIENNYSHSEIANKDIQLTQYACYFDGNRVFILGGPGHDRKVKEFDLSTGKTGYVGDLPHNYWFHEAVWYKNGIVLCGSYYDSTRCDKFEIDGKIWVKFPYLEYGRSLSGLIKWDGKLLAIGGTSRTPIVEVFDGVSWEEFDSKPGFASMAAHEAINTGKY